MTRAERRRAKREAEKLNVKRAPGTLTWKYTRPEKNKYAEGKNDG
jgi:hypothetical protein